MSTGCRSSPRAAPSGSTAPCHRASPGTNSKKPTAYCYIPRLLPANQGVRTVEPTSAEPKPRSGRRGSLENPEVIENVPGQVIPVLEREFDDFDTRAGAFLRGDETEHQFLGLRPKQGVY